MSRVRGALLALVVVVPTVLQMISFSLHPVLPDTAAGFVEVVADDPGLWALIHAVAAGAAALMVLSAPVLASLVRRRGAALAVTGATMVVLGAVALTIAFGAEVHMSALGDPSVDREAAVAIAELEDGSLLPVLLGAGFPLTGVGTILLMAGLLRSRVVPRWQPSLVLVGTLGSLAAAPGADLGPYLLAPALVGYAGLAWSVLLAHTEPDATGIPVQTRRQEVVEHQPA